MKRKPQPTFRHLNALYPCSEGIVRARKHATSYLAYTRCKNDRDLWWFLDELFFWRPVKLTRSSELNRAWEIHNDKDKDKCKRMRRLFPWSVVRRELLKLEARSW